jgi:predicted DNA-binding transcriptional regulator AlpA
MIAQQLLPPPNPEALSAEDLSAAVFAIRDKLGTKECFPDIQRIVRATEGKVDRAKTSECKKRLIQAAIDDISYIAEASYTMYQFLTKAGGVDEEAPFASYLEAAASTLTYLTRYLEHLDLRATDTAPASAAQSVAEESSVPLAGVAKPVMDTTEVAAYIGRSPWTVRHYVSEGRIPFQRTWENGFPYFLKSEIDAWLTAGHCPGARKR